MAANVVQLFLVLALSSFYTLSSATYIVRDNEFPCLMLELNAAMFVSYNSTNENHTKVAEVNVTAIEEDDMYGECMTSAGLIDNDPSVQINITLPDGSSFNATFIQHTDKGKNVSYTVLDRLIYDYDTNNNPHYVNPVVKSKFHLIHDKMNIRLCQAGKYYTCSQELVLDISADVYIRIYSVKVQAITFDKDAFSGAGEECPSEPISSSSTMTSLSTTASTLTTTIATNTTTQSTSTTSTTPTQSTSTDSTTPTQSTSTDSTTPTQSTSTDSTTPTQSTSTDSTTPTQSTSTDSTTPTQSTSTDSTTPTQSTAHPNTSTPTQPTSPTHYPITTTRKPSPPNVYYVTDDVTQNICLLMNFSATFSIPYNNTDNKPIVVYVKFNPVNSFATGACYKTTQTITLNWRPSTMPETMPTDWKLTFNFTKNTASGSNEASTSYSISQINMVYILENKTFPDTLEKGIKELSVNPKKDAFNPPIDKAYHCEANKTTQFNNSQVEMTTHNFEVQAFRNSTSTTFDKDDYRCSEDGSHSALVPIIVGIVLALLVIIVLVAYFIGRRRQQTRNNYEQI